MSGLCHGSPTVHRRAVMECDDVVARLLIDAQAYLQQPTRFHREVELEVITFARDLHVALVEDINRDLHTVHIHAESDDRAEVIYIKYPASQIIIAFHAPRKHFLRGDGKPRN